jgi:hypothetical protein
MQVSESMASVLPVLCLVRFDICEQVRDPRIVFNVLRIGDAADEKGAGGWRVLVCPIILDKQILLSHLRNDIWHCGLVDSVQGGLGALNGGKSNPQAFPIYVVLVGFDGVGGFKAVPDMNV